MDDTPQIEIFGNRAVHLDRCQVGHIADENGGQRLWFWPEYDFRRAYPLTGDLSPVLHDGVRLHAAVRGAVLRAVARTPNMSYRAKFTGYFGVPRRPFESYAGWLNRKKSLRQHRIVGAV